VKGNRAVFPFAKLLRLWYALNPDLAPLVMATTPTTPTESAANHDGPLGLRRVCNNASLSEEDIATGERARRRCVDRIDGVLKKVRRIMSEKEIALGD